MNRLIAIVFLLVPSLALAQSAGDMMTKEQLDAAAKLAHKLAGHTFHVHQEGVASPPLPLDLEHLCPEFYAKNSLSCDRGPSVSTGEAVRLVQECLSKIESEHTDMVCPHPHVTYDSPGCFGWGCTPAPPALITHFDFFYENAGSDASWAQAPLHNAMTQIFGAKKVLCYNTYVWGDACPSDN